MARHFLGWDGPALEGAADWIVTHLGKDLTGVVVALPGGRARRRLGELLARRAPTDWTPPRILTQGELIDEMTLVDRPVAGRLVRTLAWERALAGLGASELERLARRGGASDGSGGGDSLAQRLRLAETVRALHGQLAPEGLGFEELATGKARPDSGGEARRWEVLASVQEHYRAVLAGVGLADPHEERRTAIEAGRVDQRARVVLVGVADMNHLLRKLLEHVGGRASALIVAPQELESGFDALGALDVEFWRDRDVPIETEQWQVAEKPVDQADRFMDVVGGWAGRFRAEELTVGLADEQVTPYLERRLTGAGVTARNAAGLAIERTRPFRLLAACARFLERRRYGELAALVRHPDLELRLRQDQGLFSIDPAAALDEYYLEHLPDAVDGRWVDDKKLVPAVREMHAAVVSVLGDLDASTDGGQKPLGAWGEAVRGLFTRVYGEDELDPAVEAERVLAEALSTIGTALSEIEELPPDLVPGSVAAADALSLLLRQLRGRSIPPRPPAPGESTVELLGWLELPLDDAPALVVTGFNEGRVPQSVHGDPFLPNGVRKDLGLPDNDARLARDVYAASVVVHAREAVAFVTGRRSLEGDPLVPSRLSFHVSDEVIVERVQRFLPDEGGRLADPKLSSDEAGGEFSLPMLEGKQASERMGVSSFRTYLESPYGYYLKHVLRLETLDDRARELDPLRFGNFAHDVLFAFGKSDTKDATDERAIKRYLTRAVDRMVKERFGRTPLPAIVLQAEQLKYRLGVFAKRQAEWASRGWRIAHVEHAPEGDGVPFEVDDAPVFLRGRIDRIDRHPDWGWAVLDYKTGDKLLEPDEAHRKRGGEWKDLQLPLYQHLARAIGLEGDIQLGYVTVGKDEGAISFRIAREWAEADLESAWAAARDVVRNVRAGRFDELGREPYEEIFQAIHGKGLIASELAPESV
ncbi:MAG: hypothetical protein GY711_23410 [bacterium]|nr:hypothetical protein [bacterium]